MRRFSLLPFTLIIALSSWGVSFAADAPAPEIAQHVQDEIILRFRGGTDEASKVMAHFRVGGRRAKVFRILEGLEVVKLPRGLSVSEAMQFYAQHPEVLYAEPNYIVRTTVMPNDPRFAEMWGLDNSGQLGGTPGSDIDAVRAWDITTGSNEVVVAVIDSGIDYNHPDLSANLFRNTAECNGTPGVDDDGNGYIDDCFGIDTFNNDSDPMDDNRHGTHVAGTIGASGNNGVGVVGVNWNVKLMPCKFTNASGSGTTAGAIACLDYVKTLKDRGVNIVATNNSWGGGGFSQALVDAINAQRQRGILFIAAAGNGDFFGIGQDNDSSPFYPCSYYLANNICVASTTRTDSRSSFSNFGRRTVHIGAPGSDILSAIPGNSYSTLSGTSMATPHVTGVAALLKAQAPNRDWKSIKNLILTGGENIASLANTITQKRLNAHGALTCSNSPLLSRLRPIGDTVSGSVGTPVQLAAIHINCANPNGNVAVTVNPGSQIVTLLDDGLNSDQAAGDGIYSGQWTPSATGNFTLTFPNGDVVTVSVNTATISVTPSTLDFGNVAVGSSADRNFTVQNAGSGTLTGNASTSSPYSIVAGGSYSLAAGQSQTVTVRFSPTSDATFSGNVTFTGGGGASRTVTGVGVLVALSASPTSIQAGGTVTATWSGIPSPTATDWIGLYAPGVGDTGYISWRYTTGTVSGNVPFVIPSTVASGTYELRLFSNNGYSRLATSNSFTVTPPPPPPPANLSASPTSVQAGGSVTATWSNIAAPTALDWIGLYTPGTGDTGYISWRRTTGTASGSVPFAIPASVAPGTYELRLYSNNSYSRLATSNSFTVTPPPPPPPANLSASPSSVPAGGTLTATWSNIATPTSLDWIGLYTPGAADTAYIASRYTTGTSSGNVPFVVPASVAPGTYQLRLFSNNGYTRLATSNPFMVTPAPPATLSATPTSIPAGGTLTATWSNIATPTSTDWIGLYTPGTGDIGGYISWRYTTGAAGGNVPFVIPGNLAPGTYELRLFSNNGYSRLAVSNTFSVTSLTTLGSPQRRAGFWSRQ